MTRWDDTCPATLTTLAMTCDGHAAETIPAAKASPAAAAALVLQVSDEVPPRGPGAPARTGAEAAAAPRSAPHIQRLSMSWRLPGAVRTYLDSQICERGGVAQYEDLIGRLGAP